MKKTIFTNKILMSLLSIGGMFLLLGTSYALFSNVVLGNKNQVIKTGTLIVTFLNEGNAINLNNGIPITDLEGESTTPYTFTIKNTGTLEQNYKITIDETTYNTAEHNDTGKKFPSNSLKYSLTKIGDTVVSSVYNTNSVMGYGKLAPNAETTYTLKLWINIDAGNDAQNKHFHGKIKVEVGQGTEPLKLVDVIETNLGVNGTVYEPTPGSTKYIRSATTTTDPSLVNNYVWWSGMMWRIYAINPDGSMKIITDDNVSTLPFHNVKGSNVYTTSHMKQWLETYFYPKLNSSKDTVLKQNNDFCIDSTDDANSARTSCTNKLSNLKVGLLTVDEYNIVKNGSNNNYLNSGPYYWLMTPHTSSASSEWCAYYGGSSSSYDVGSAVEGSRVVTVFASASTISSGNGTLGIPYKITGDTASAVSGTKLNSRHTGEFITYDNKLWRIMEVENGLTKVIYDGATAMPTGDFGTNNLDWATMKARLDSIGISTAKIAQNQTWQRGYFDHGNNVLATSLGAGNPVTSTFGLPKVGEIWSSQNNSNTANYAKFMAQYYWLMTPYTSGAPFEWYALPYGHSSRAGVNAACGSRVVFFFKSDVIINSGDGTPNSPYALR
ncbi:MAG: hypothetical protein RR161_03225 [Bacilli bacterium]